MAKINDATDKLQWYGSKFNVKQMKLAVPGGPDANKGGVFFLEAIDSSGDAQGGLFLHTDGTTLRVSTSDPSDTNLGGYALDNTTIGAAANKALSNLASVAIAVDFDPAATNTYDLGDATHVFAESFVTKSVFYPTDSYITGTSGIATLTGALVCGADGTGSDVTLIAATSGSFAKWTKTTTGVFGLTDDAIIAFGDGSDFTMKFNASAMLLDNKTANTGNLLIGSAVDTDVTLESQSAAGKDIHWDASAYMLRILDDVILGFGTGAGTDSDIQFIYTGASTNILNIGQTVNTTGSITIGADDEGMDVTFFAETAGDYMKWDENGASNLGALVFEDSVIQISGANVAYTMGISTDALVVTGTDHANNNVVFGTTSTTNATDVTFSCASSGDHVKFVGTGTWTYTDVPVTCTGADQSGTLLTVTGIDTTGNSDTVVVTHKGTASALKIANATTAACTALVELVPMAVQSGPCIWIDGDTNGWLGGDDVGAIMVNNDIPGTHVDSTLLRIESSAQPIASGSGVLANFELSGAARSGAYAMRIKVPTTQDAFFTDGGVVITGQAAHGAALVQITGNDAGNNVALDVHNEGTAAALQITGDDTDSLQFKVVAKASQTTSAVVIDGATTDWIGNADDVGMVHLTAGTTALAHVGSTMLFVNNTAKAKAAAQGGVARFLQTGSATVAAYGVEIAAPATGGALNVSAGQTIFGGGVQVTPLARTAEATPGAGTSTIAAGDSSITVTSAHTDSAIVLPTAVLGDVIMLKATAATDFELQAPVNTVFINGTECTGTPPKEILVTAEDVTFAICTKAGSAGTWVTYSVTSAGVVTNGVTPD